MNNIIYISSSLDKKEKKEERNIGIYRDKSLNNQLVIDNKVYILLTPAVYGWLRKQMDKAHLAYQAGRLMANHWNALRQRFYPLHDWAIETYGRQAIAEAVSLPQKNPFVIAASEAASSTNEPATAHRYPLVGEYSHAHPVTPAAVAQVDAIRNKAIVLGWTEKGLYQNRGNFSFPYGQDYGLVCFLDKDKHIGNITRQYIELIGLPPHENRLKFYNQDVDQLRTYPNRQLRIWGNKSSRK